MTDPVELRDAIIARARTLGFHRVGITRARAASRYDAYLAWLEAGYHGDMAYMAADDHRTARADLERVAAGASSVICVAMAYDHREPDLDPAERGPRGRIARYARGDDYHRLLKQRLYQLADDIASLSSDPVAARPCTDSAPVLERALGERAGVGFVGKNTMLITPGLGSYTVLGELLTTAAIAATAPAPIASHRCGECRACIEACPTGALVAPFVLDARRCISYLTIEHRGAIPKMLRPALGDMVFGCDICQDVCPYNAAAPGRSEPAAELRARDREHARPSLAALAAMGSSQWKRFTEDSALRRAGRAGLVRNTAVALGNSGDPAAIGPLEQLLGHDDPMIREHAAWALEAIAGRARTDAPTVAPAAVAVRAYRESDWTHICEIHDLARISELAASGLTAAFLRLEVTATPEGLFDGDVWVLEADGAPRGFAAARAAGGGREISWLYVHPGWQRRGVGRALLRVIAGAPGRLEVEALAENRAAIALYESEGFTIERRTDGRLEGNESFAARGVHLGRD